MYQINKATVYKGRAAEFSVIYVDEKGNEYDTCNCTSALVRIENQDGTFLEKAPSTGIIWGTTKKTYLHVYTFSAAETALFKAGIKPLQVKLSYGENYSKIEFKEFLTVLNDLF